MTRVFSSNTRLEAWLNAAAHLTEAEMDLNIVLSIASPGTDGPGSGIAYDILDRFYEREGELPLHAVAETIFPGWQYSKRGLRGVYETYESEYEALKKGDPSRWGTYAHRLVRRQRGDGTIVNPLAQLISKMQDELDTRGTKRSCYEVGVTEGEYDLPLYSTADDLNRRRNLPCLSHLSFTLLDDAVHLTALFRSHDYRYKVPGNLLGLARLQSCVANEVGLSIGTLVVHSTYAWLRGAKQRFRDVIAALSKSALDTSAS